MCARQGPVGVRGGLNAVASKALKDVDEDSWDWAALEESAMDKAQSRDQRVRCWNVPAVQGSEEYVVDWDIGPPEFNFPELNKILEGRNRLTELAKSISPAANGISEAWDGILREPNGILAGCTAFPFRVWQIRRGHEPPEQARLVMGPEFARSGG